MKWYIISDNNPTIVEIGDRSNLNSPDSTIDTETVIEDITTVTPEEVKELPTTEVSPLKEQKDEVSFSDGFKPKSKNVEFVKPDPSNSREALGDESVVSNSINKTPNFGADIENISKSKNSKRKRKKNKDNNKSLTSKERKPGEFCFSWSI